MNSRFHDSQLIPPSLHQNMVRMLAMTLATLWSFLVPMTIAQTSTTDEPTPRAGVNIISVGNSYSDPVFAEGEVDKFMAKLAESNIQHISIRVTWETMEREQGVYNANIIANLRRVAEAAGRAGINVMLDFHTLFHKGSYTAPKWLANFPGRNDKPGVHSVIMIARNPDAAQAYLDMQRHVMTQLKDVQAIDVIALANEPWPHWDEGPEGAKADMDSISDVLIRSGKLVHEINPQWKRAIRFTSSFNPWSDHDNKKFDEAKTFEAADIIGLNVYLDPTGTIDNEGADGALRDGASWTSYRRSVQAIRASGREVWITEFGMSANGKDAKGVPNSWERQRQYFEGICDRWWDGDHRPHALLVWVLEPNLKSMQGFDIWDMKIFDWNAAGQVYVKYAQRGKAEAAGTK